MLTEIRVYENVKDNLIDLVLKDNSSSLYQEMIEIMAECISFQTGKINFIAQNAGVISISDIKNRDKLLDSIDSYIKAEYNVENIKTDFLYGRIFFYELY